MSVENKPEYHRIEIQVGNHLVEIDSKLLEPNALNSVNSTTNKIGYYICADRYILTTEANVKNWRFSTFLFRTDLEEISQLFFSIHSGKLIKDKLLVGIDHPNKKKAINLSHSLGAVNLFHYLNHQIGKRNRNIDTFLKSKIPSFLARIPLFKSYLESWYPKIRDVNEMMINSFNAVWLKGKEEIATEEQILEIECFVGSITRKGLECLEEHKNTLQEFKVFQTALPIIKDPNKIAEELNKLEGEKLELAYKTMKSQLEEAEKATYYKQCANWSELKASLDDNYKKRLEETDPVLKKANELSGKDNVLGVSANDSYERIDQAYNALLCHFPEDCKKFPESSQKKIEQAKDCIKKAYFNMHAERINSLVPQGPLKISSPRQYSSHESSLKEPSPGKVFDSLDFATCRIRFKSLLNYWKDESEKYNLARGRILNAYRELLKEQLSSLTLPSTTFSAMNARYAYLKDIIEDYSLVVFPKKYKSKKEILEVLEANKIKCEKSLFPVVYEVEGIADNFGVASIKPEEMTLALYVGVVQKGIQGLDELLASFSEILQKQKSADNLPPEMKTRLDAAVEKAGKRFAAEYTRHLESIQNKIVNSPKAEPGITYSVLSLFQKAYSNISNLFKIKEANFNRAKEQFLKVLFLKENTSHSDIILRAETMSHLLKFLNKKYVELFQTKQKAYERSLVLLELHSVLEKNPTLSLMKVLDPNNEIKGDMLVLENKVETLLETLAEELMGRNEILESATINKLNRIKTLVETGWNALLKEKYPLIVKYDLPVNEYLDEILFPLMKEEEALKEKIRILSEFDRYEVQNVPKFIKEKISYLRDVVKLAYQLKVAKNICTLGAYNKQSTLDLLEEKLEHLEVITESARKKLYITMQYGIPSNSDIREIKTRYRKLGLLIHPDRQHYKDGFLPDNLKTFFEDKFKILPTPDFLRLS